MKVDESKLSIATMRDMFERGDLVANKEYQRSPGLWPNASRSYFIDTILEGFPFPKVFFHEFLSRDTRKVRTEIVDGQQRISTIMDFINDRLILGKNSINYAGMRFSDLDEDIQDRFLFSTVSIDMIRDARKPDILQMFRRMNAYTLPLNAAEKRHSEFFGEFKDAVTRILDHQIILSEWDVFTTRQTVRMADAQFVADLILAIEDGIVSTSDAQLNALYKKYDASFPNADYIEKAIHGMIRFVTVELSALKGSFMTKPYVLHSLLSALYHNRYGLPNFAEQSGLHPIGAYSSGSLETVVNSLLELAAAHEGKDTSRYPQYVEAMAAGSNRAAQRKVRVETLCRALRSEL